MSDMDDDLRYFRSIDALHKRAVTDAFPGIPINYWSQSGADFYIEVPKENINFYDSGYFYKGKREFFHLTSIRNLFSILNDKAFRMYDLHSSADPEELAYAGRILGLSDRHIDLLKRYYFTLSFCPIAELRNKAIWDTYGSREGSAAIVFEVANDPRDWVKYHMSEIKYAVPGSFEAYRKSAKEIEEQNKGIALHCDLSRLMGFHKASGWEGEKEIRISAFQPFGDLEEYDKFTKLEWRLKSGRNRITRYMDLPIWVDNESSYVKSFGKREWDRTRILPDGYFYARPKVKIKAIHIGANTGLSAEEFYSFKGLLSEMLRLNYGYDIEVDDELLEI